MKIFQLRWEHVLWDQGRMLVTIPTMGKKSRFVPIGEILFWLETEFHEAPGGARRLNTRFTESLPRLSQNGSAIL